MASMTRLQLCQRLARECGVPGEVPITTIAQTGESRRLVDWIDDAWNDIQCAHQDWGWMRTSASWVTVAGTYNYTTTDCGITAGTFGMWQRRSFRNYPTATGNTAEVEMYDMDYDDWRGTYLFGGNRSVRTRPIEFAIGPNKAINLGPVPDVGYTITADYFTAPLDMAADADVPAIPVHFNMAIVYRAMMAYAGFDAASEVYQRGELEFGKLMRRMTADRIPEAGFSGALV